MLLSETVVLYKHTHTQYVLGLFKDTFQKLYCFNFFFLPYFSDNVGYQVGSANEKACFKSTA